MAKPGGLLSLPRASAQDLSKAARVGWPAGERGSRCRTEQAQARVGHEGQLGGKAGWPDEWRL